MKEDNRKQETKTKQAAQVITPATAGTITETDKGSTTTETANYEIYNNTIYAIVDDFININYAGLTETELKENKAFFPLLIDYLYNNYIGDYLGNKNNKRLPYKDIKAIDNLFNIYTSLVYKYKWNNKPYIIEFSLFTGITRDTIYSWLNGDSDNYIDGVNDYITTRERSDIVQKWVDTCERALLDNNDTIKDIFILKAKHGYRDNNNDITITVNHKSIIDADTLPDLIGLTDSKNC